MQEINKNQQQELINIITTALSNKGINISINDNKKLIRLFDGKLEQLLFQYPSINFNNKTEMITFLNKKPKSFFSKMKKAIKDFLKIQVQVNKNQISSYAAYPVRDGLVKNKNKIKTAFTKREGEGLLSPAVAGLPALRILAFATQSKGGGESIKNLRWEGGGGIELNNPNLYYKLTNKINKLTNKLSNNKLSIPLNLLALAPGSFCPKGAVALQGALASRTGEKDNYKNNLSSTYLRTLPSKGWTHKYFKLITSFKDENLFQESISYKFNNNNNYYITDKTNLIESINKILDFGFKSMSCLSSKPVFMETPDKIIIKLFYVFMISREHIEELYHKYMKFVPKISSLNGIKINENKHSLLNKNKVNLSKLNKFLLSKSKSSKGDSTYDPLFFAKGMNTIDIFKLKTLSNVLSKIFKKPIEMDLTRLNHVYQDDHILVKFLGILSETESARFMFLKLFNKIKIRSKNKILQGGAGVEKKNIWRFGSQSSVSGIKIRIGGRLKMQRIIPKKTTVTANKGAIQRGKVDYVDLSQIHLKSKKGAYTITVKLSHIL